MDFERSGILYFFPPLESLRTDLLSNFKLERKRRYLLNVPKWTQFCKEVKTARMGARANGRRWGLPHGYKSDTDESDSEIDFKLAGSFSEDALMKLKRTLKRVNEKPPKSGTKSKRKREKVRHICYNKS